MKIRFTQSDLAPALAAASRVATKKSSNAILENILLRTNGDELSIVATDLERQITLPVVADILDAGNQEVTVGAHKINSIVQSLAKDAVITLDASDNHATIKTGRSRFKVNTLPANEFPTFQDDNSEPLIVELHGGILPYLLEKSAYAAAKQDVRYYLNGVLFELQHDCIVCVGTDGHRMAKVEHNQDIASVEKGNPRKFIIPESAIADIQKLSAHGEVTLGFSSRSLTMRNEKGVVFQVRYIDGQFPEYGRVIPGERSNNAIIHREAFLSCVKRCVLLSDQRYAGVRLTFSSDALRIEATNSDKEEASDEIDIDYRMADIVPEGTVGFNAQYVKEALESCEGEVIYFAFGDANDSVKLCDSAERNSGAINVIMPMRL